MYLTAQLVVKSYIPDGLKKGMWFVRKYYEKTEKEFTEVYTLDSIPQDEDTYIKLNGYPVKPFIVEEYLDGSIPAILATPDEIGWWDEGEHTEDLRDITLDDMSDIFNFFNGFIMIDVDGETGEPVLAEGKVILTYVESQPQYEYEPEDYDDYGIVCDECGSPDVGVNSSDQIICNNCGWEEGNEE